VRPGLNDIRIWSRTSENANRLADEVGARSVTIDHAAGADVVLTVTSAATPILEGRWLAPRTLVIAVGATGATMRELDDEVFSSSFVVAECKAAAGRESGDIRMSGTSVDAEIGEIAAKTQGISMDRRIVFKSVGMAIEDLTAARLVWQTRQAESK
jgi:thiomorpholine-carboxylate dehydrogenase